MARRDYELTTQTVKVMNGSAKNVAEEMDVSDKYIYAILAGTETDPFSKFQVLYAAAVRAGCDVSHWENRLESIKEKYRGTPFKCVDTITSQFVKESADVAIAHIDPSTSLYDQLREVNQALTKAEELKLAILKAINADTEAEGQPRARFNGNVRDIAKKAVQGRRVR